MAKITRIEALMVDLVPAVKRTDAIQSFVSQQTPILRITDADGAVGTGYSYTIGTGGPAIMSLLQHTLATPSRPTPPALASHGISTPSTGPPSQARCSLCLEAAGFAATELSCLTDSKLHT